MYHDVYLILIQYCWFSSNYDVSYDFQFYSLLHHSTMYVIDLIKNNFLETAIHTFFLPFKKMEMHVILYISTTFIPLLASVRHYIVCSKLHLPYLGIKLFNLPCSRTVIKENCSWKTVATASASSANFIIWQKILKTLNIFITQCKCTI